MASACFMPVEPHMGTMDKPTRYTLLGALMAVGGALDSHSADVGVGASVRLRPAALVSAVYDHGRIELRISEPPVDQTLQVLECEAGACAPRTFSWGEDGLLKIFLQEPKSYSEKDPVRLRVSYL